MTSPIFDAGTGSRFGQKVLDNLLYGINFQDERNFQKSNHVSASIVNVLFCLLQIGVGFIPKSLGYITPIIQCIISLVISLFYFTFSFLPSKRQAERIRDKISSKDQFFNALMFCYNPVGYKVFHLIAIACTPAVFFIISYFTKLHQFPIIFIQMAVSSGLRQVDSSMAKYKPVSHQEPSLTHLVYIAGFSAVAFKSVVASTVLLCFYPFLICFGLLPQFICLFFFAFDYIAKFVALPVNSVESVLFSTCMVINYVLLPFDSTIMLGFYCLTCWSYSKSWKARSVVQFIVCIGCTAAIIAMYLTKKSIYQALFLQTQIVRTNELNIIGCGLGIGLSTWFVVCNTLNVKQSHQTGSTCMLKLNSAMNIIYSIGALIFACLSLIDILQSDPKYLYLNSLFALRQIGYAFFKPEAINMGIGLGCTLNFAYFYSYDEYIISMGLGGMFGSVFFDWYKRLVPSIQYYYHMQKLAFKVHDDGWQSRFYKARWLLWIWNLIVIFVCTFVDYSILPIGGIPLLMPFHPHPRAFFVNKQNISKYSSSKAELEDQSGENIENKDDVVIYNQAAEKMFGYKQKDKQLRLLTMAHQLEIGDCLILMQDKQIFFIQTIGRNCFNSSVNVIVHALETKETTCHTLERTCMERYYEYVQKDLKKKETKTKLLQAGLCSPQVVCETKQLSALAPGSRKPVTLGGGANRNQQQTQQNRLPQNIPQMTDSWLPFYVGFFGTQSFDTSEFSLTGMFGSKQVLDQIGDCYIGALYLLLESSNTNLGSINKIPLDLQDFRCQHIVASIKKFVAAPNKQIVEGVLKICQIQNFINDINNESQLVENYENCSNSIANSQLKAIISRAYRTSAWYAVNQISMGDEMPQDLQQLHQMLNECNSIFIGLPKEQQWQDELKGHHHQKMFALLPGPRAVQYSYKSVDWQVYKIPQYYYQMVWNAVQTDMLVFNSTDDERFSVQSLPPCLRNLLGEAASSPFGYPLIIYGEAVM